MEGTESKKRTHGNPYRCKICGNFASSDFYCSRCRENIEADQDYPLNRKVYFNYGGNFGRKTPFFSREGYGVVSKEYGIAKKRW